MAVIAVVGASGNIGSRVVARLVGQGSDVRAVSCDPGGVPDGVEAVAADLSDPDRAREALQGAAGVYLTPPEGGEDPLQLETTVARNVIDAAAALGVEHLVLHTAVHADRGDTGARVLDNKTALEEALASSGIGYTILRPAWFLQNLWAAREYIEQGVVSMPWPGDMIWAATDISDVAEAAAAFFASGPANRGFDLHVPGGITGNQLAEAASRVLGRPVAYQEAPVTSREFVEAFPISDPHKDIYAELFDYFKSTTYLGDTDPIQKALGGFEIQGPDRFFAEELFAS